MLRIGPLVLDAPAVMGVLNVTPDSFSDGGRFTDRDGALRHAEAMAADGAQVVDIGGESTRPGAGAVDEQQELDRILPVIEAIRENLDVPVSVDTSKPGVMRAAVAAGAVLVNDIFALRQPGALEAVADLGCPACLMHMRGQPRTMQDDPQYDDVVADVTAFLQARVAECVAAGIDRDRLIVDPGFGFGKRPEHNVRLLAGLPALRRLGCPVLIGISRKATLGRLTGRDVGDRLPASVAAAVLAVTRGAQIVRAHDVGATVDALKIAQAVMDQEGWA